MRPGSIEALEKRLLAIPQEVREAVAPAVVQGAQELQRMAQHLAPVDTGALRDSIEVTLPGGKTPAYSQPGGSRVAGELEALVTAGNSDVRYPHNVEHGTATAAARPYFWPAFRTLRKRIEARIRRRMRKAARDAFAGRQSTGDEG